MASRVKSVVGLNGVVGHSGAEATVGKAKRVKAPKAKPAVSMTALRRTLTVGMGCGIPGLSLALSTMGGRLMCESKWGLGAGALVLCGTVLAVSLSHLAWAIRDITKSALWQSWCLAVAIDLAVVLCELSRVAGFELWVVPVLMGCVTVASAGLNCWAFLRHK